MQSDKMINDSVFFTPTYQSSFFSRVRKLAFEIAKEMFHDPWRAEQHRNTPRVIQTNFGCLDASMLQLGCYLKQELLCCFLSVLVCYYAFPAAVAYSLFNYYDLFLPFFLPSFFLSPNEFLLEYKIPFYRFITF